MAGFTAPLLYPHIVFSDMPPPVIMLFEIVGEALLDGTYVVCVVCQAFWTPMLAPVKTLLLILGEVQMVNPTELKVSFSMIEPLFVWSFQLVLKGVKRMTAPLLPMKLMGFPVLAAAMSVPFIHNELLIRLTVTPGRIVRVTPLAITVVPTML